MASMEPSEAEISQVVDFAGLDHDSDRTMIVQALKNNSRNVESVVMSYFDDPDAFRKRFSVLWSDGMFSADRNGEMDIGTGSSFHVEEPNPNPTFYIEPSSNSVHRNDLTRRLTPPHGAPSRPPSRADARSPHERVIDMNASNVPRFVGQSSSADLNQDMEWALRESAQEAGITMPGQESGVVENHSSTPYFGPATRSQYDCADWSLVPAGPAAVTWNALPPSERQRKTNAPAFLIQHPNTAGSHRLGGLLTILHEIPLARNILLQCGSVAETYGYDNEWWKGKSIVPPLLAQATTPNGNVDSGSDSDSKPGFEEEIHRLMAFLDSTDRSYGSTSALVDMVPSPETGPEKQFYESLRQRNEDKVLPLTHLVSLATVFGGEIGNEGSRFGLLEVDHPRSDYNLIKTFYEALDHLMWSDVLSWNELNVESRMAMFKEMGDVFAVKFGTDGPEDSLDIPVEFYPERYLSSRKQEASRIQKSWRETKNAATRLFQEKEALHQWCDDFGQHSLHRDLRLKKASEQWKVLQNYLHSAGQFAEMHANGFDTNKFPDYHEAPERLDESQQKVMGKVGDVVALIEQVRADMDQKLQDINMKLAAYETKLRYLGRLLLDPNKAGRPKPMTCKRYLLRGVATDTDIIYVCQRQQVNLIDLDKTSQKTDQWWRLAYAHGEEHPVKADKIEIERVLRDVWQETKTPALVYATEEALEQPKEPLCDALERFIKADNKAFRQEVSIEKSSEQEPSSRGRQLHFLNDSVSLSKRKHRSDSIDSMDANCASVGSDEENGLDNNPFADQLPTFSFCRDNMEYGGTLLDSGGGGGGVGGGRVSSVVDGMESQQCTDLAGMIRENDGGGGGGGGVEGVEVGGCGDGLSLRMGEESEMLSRELVMMDETRAGEGDGDGGDVMDVEEPRGRQRWK